jgi:biotin synthase
LALWPANSLFVEGYLTTRGDAVGDTYRMIRDAGFEVAGNPLYREEAGQASTGFRLPEGNDQILKPDMARDG